MNIQLIPLTEFKFKGKGKYLVRTQSLIGAFKSTHYIMARVNESDNGKVFIDVNSQKVTHISSERILDGSIFGGKDIYDLGVNKV